MLKTLFALLCFAGSVQLAHADLQSDFEEINGKGKGPFGDNILQGKRNRVAVRDGGSPSGGTLFQAAYRNSKAQRLVSTYGFYTGNLYTTNYYTLMGEFVFGDEFGSHTVDHEALLTKANEAMPKAAAMVRDWNLEKAYVEYFPTTKFSLGFKLRGISDVANELEYARYFYNFFLSSLTPGEEDSQFLTAFILAKESPLSDLNAVNRARNLVAEMYDSFKEAWGVNDSRVRGLYKIRNAVHNQLSPDVIRMIDEYLDANPWYKKRGHTNLLTVKTIVQDYFAAKPDRIISLARSLDMETIKEIAKDLKADGASAEKLLALSQEATTVRAQIIKADGYPAEKRTDVLLLLMNITRYLNKELLSLKRDELNKDAVMAALNSIYIEGFLISDNWEYFRSDIQSATDVKAAASVLADVASVATDNLVSAHGDSIKNWKAVEPGMEKFVDNTIKSSAVNVASVLYDKLAQ